MIKRHLQCLYLLFSVMISGIVIGQTPEFQWVKLDGFAEAGINTVAYSSTGDFVYVGGWIKNTGGTNFPTTVPAGEGQNGLVAKYTSAGTLVWAFNIGGSDDDEVTAIAVDASDNLIVGGYFESSSGADFSGTSGTPTSLISTGNKDVFLAKYSPSGVLTWVNQGTSSDNETVNDIAVDASNAIYVAGSSSGNFTYGGSSLTHGGSGDGFAMRVLSNGSLSWLRSFDTNGEDEFVGVTVMGSYVYFGGYYSGSRTFYLLGLIPLGVSSTGGAPDMMVVKYGLTSGDLEELQVFKGSNTDKILALTNDGTNLYFTGSTVGGLTIGSYNESRSQVEIVTAKIDSDLNPIWTNVTQHTGVGIAVGNDIAVLPNGKIMVAGAFSGTLNTSFSPNQVASGGTDGIMLTYSGSSGVVTHQSKISGNSDITAKGIRIKNNNEVFVAGTNIGNTTFSPLGVFNANSSSNHPFLAKYGCTNSTATISGPSSVCSGESATMTITFTGPSPYSGTVTDGVDNYSFSGITASSYTFVVVPSVASTTIKNLTFSAFTSGSCASSTLSGHTYTAYAPITSNVISSDVTICSGSIPSFTGMLPSGGDGSIPVYQWQYFNGLIWLPGTNVNNLQDYTSVNLTNPVKFRRQVTIGGCPVSLSNELQVTVQPSLANNTIANSQTICGPAAPLALTGSVAVGGNGTIAYQWQSSPDNSNWTNEVLTQNFAPPSLSATRYYRRQITSGFCTVPNTSNVLTVTVHQPIGNNILSSDQAICSGDTPLLLNGGTPTGGNNASYSYSWQSSPDLSSWSNAVGTNNELNYSPPALTQDRYYRRIVSSGVCALSTSNILSITIHPPISNNFIFNDQTICANTIPAVLTGTSPVGGGGTSTIYEWEMSVDNVNFIPATGTNNLQNYSPPELTASHIYRRKVTRGTCGFSYSDTVYLTVQQPIASNTIASNENLCVDSLPEMITGTTPTGGSGVYTYAWLVSSDNVGYAPVTPAVTSVDFLPTGSTNSYYYKRVTGSGVCSADTSNAVLKQVYSAVSNNVISSDEIICSGTSASTIVGSTPVGGDDINYNYLWESSMDFSVWVPAAGFNTGIDYNPGVIGVETYYRRQVSSAGCINYVSNVVSVSIYPPIVNNFVAGDQTICVNTSPVILTGTSPTGGGGISNIFEWEWSTDNVNFSPASGVNTLQNYTSSPLLTTTYFRRKVTRGTCGFTYSDTVTIVVEDEIANNAISGIDSVCIGDVPQTILGLQPTGGSGTYSYAWLFSTDQLNFATVSPAANSINFSPTASVETHYYKRVVFSGVCPSDTSSVLEKYVFETLANNTILGDQTICESTSPTLIAGSTPTGGGPGPLYYQWEQSLDDISFTAAAGVFDQINYQPGNLSTTTFFRRRVVRGPCDTSYSNSVKVTVEQWISNNNIVGPSQICSNNSSETITGLVPIYGNGTYIYQWQRSWDSLVWVALPGAIAQNYALGAVSTSAHYRRIVTSGFCAADTSASIFVQVDPLVTTNTISADQANCYDSIPNLLSGVVQLPNAFTYTWEESTNGINYFTAAGIPTGASYQPGNLQETTTFYRIISSGVCPKDTSNTVTITVFDTLTSNTISASGTVCYGTSGVFLSGSVVSGGNGTYYYLWESSTDNVNFSTATASSTNSNYTSGILSQTMYYRRKVISGACLNDTSISNTVVIAVQPPLDNNTISGNQILCGDYQPTILSGSAAAGGSGTPNYQWQSSLDLVTWSDESNTQNLTWGIISDTIYFRRKVNSGFCTIEDISDTVTLVYLDAISGNTISGNETICSGNFASTLISTGLDGGDFNYTFVWQQSIDNLNWNSALGTNNADVYSSGTLTQTTYFRRIVNSANCYSDTSNVVTVFVEDTLDNNLISISSSICSDDPNAVIDGTLPTNGSGAYAYQWQTSLDGILWTSISGATAKDLPLGAISTATFYRRIVTSGFCDADTSNHLLVVVDPAVNANSIAANQTACYATAPALFTGVNPIGTGFNYQWEYSADGSVFTPAPGTSINSDYQSPPLTQTSYFRRIITSGVCSADTSNSLVINIYDTISNNYIFNDTSVCYGTTGIILEDSVLVGGSGNFSYAWESSADGLTFVPITGVTSAHYTTGTLFQTTYLRRRVTDQMCANYTSVSNVILITVHTQLSATIANLTDSVCRGDLLTAPVILAGDAPFQFSFSYNGQDSTVSNYSGTAFDFTFAPLQSDYLAIDFITDVHGCTVVPTDTLFFVVNDYPTIDLGDDTSVCDAYLFSPTISSGNLSFNSPTLGVLPVNFPLTYEADVFGTHDFILSQDLMGCVSFDTVTVTFEESIGFISAGADQELFIQDSTALDASPLLSNQSGYWTLISGGGAFADSTDPTTVMHDLISGETLLEWTVTQNVCPSKSAQVRLVVGNLVIPTGFSPNGDGQNDYLEVAGREDISTVKIQVYDRWGGLIFQDKDYQNDWRGTTNSGEDLPEDTYFVIVDLGEKGLYKSYIIIRR